MAYTTTKYFNPRAFNYPAGFENTQHLTTARGIMADCDTATFYTTGGVGSTSFQVTAFSAVGLVTYSLLVGMPLYNGQKVVVFNTASNTNDGTYIVSALATTSSTAGTFVALPGPTAIAGSAQTSQTAEGVGQIQWSQRQFIAGTFTATAVTVSGGVSTVTYTTLVGPQLQPGDNVTISGMTNSGNNGIFSLVTVTPTSSTAGSFTINNPIGKATDSGTGVSSFKAGLEGAYNNLANPIQVSFLTSKGYVYYWNQQNQTIQVFLTGASSGAILAEAALGATVLVDLTLTFEAIFVRAKA